MLSNDSKQRRTSSASKPPSRQMSVKSVLSLVNAHSSASLWEVAAVGSSASFIPLNSTCVHRHRFDFDLTSRLHFVEPPENVLCFYLPIIFVHDILHGIKHHTLIKVRSARRIEDVDGDGNIDLRRLPPV